MYADSAPGERAPYSNGATTPDSAKPRDCVTNVHHFGQFGSLIEVRGLEPGGEFPTRPTRSGWKSPKAEPAQGTQGRKKVTTIHKSCSEEVRGFSKGNLRR